MRTSNEISNGNCSAGNDCFQVSDRERMMSTIGSLAERPFRVVERLKADCPETAQFPTQGLGRIKWQLLGRLETVRFWRRHTAKRTIGNPTMLPRLHFIGSYLRATSRRAISVRPLGI